MFLIIDVAEVFRMDLQAFQIYSIGSLKILGNRAIDDITEQFFSWLFTFLLLIELQYQFTQKKRYLQVFVPGVVTTLYYFGVCATRLSRCDLWKAMNDLQSMNRSYLSLFLWNFCKCIIFLILLFKIKMFN